jgi:hypothetical protein
MGQHNTEFSTVSHEQPPEVVKVSLVIKHRLSSYPQLQLTAISRRLRAPSGLGQ